MNILCLPGCLPIDYTIQLANALSKHENVMILLSSSVELNNHIQNIDEHVRLCIIPEIGKPLFRLRQLYKLSNIIKAIYTIKRFNPDIIHTQHCEFLSPHFLILWASTFTRPLVLTIHDVKPHYGTRWPLSLKIATIWLKRKSKAIFVHGQLLKKVMVSDWHVRANMVHVIPLGEINVAPFLRYINKAKEKMNKEKCNDKNILFFGNIKSYKGLEYLINAEKIISKRFPNIRFIIAGQVRTRDDVLYYNYCKSLITNISHYELYPQFISWEFGAELFTRCDLVVLPYNDRFSHTGVVATAYGFRKPVIVTDVGCIPELVDIGKTGLVVPPRDSKKLAEAIIRLLEDDSLRVNMGSNAYLKLKRDLSWDNIAEKTIDVYKNILHN
jgi:glycosyltransferase involved in cell wall biosynthesis